MSGINLAVSSQNVGQVLSDNGQELSETSNIAKTWHTPGPWRTNGTVIEGPKMALRIGSVYPPQIGNAPKDDAEWRANARLIVAAPDLLEFAQWVEARGSDNNQMEIFRRAREVVAKAAASRSGEG